MPSLKEFLFNKDIGVESTGDALHIGASLAEHILMGADMFEVVTPTIVVPGAAAGIPFATIAGVSAAVVGPILGLAGVFMALGSGYAEAREEIQNEAIQGGFAQGFVAGLLNMSPKTVRSIFAQQGVIHRNVMDEDADVIEMRAHNRGLVAGYAMANTATPNEKKAYIFEIREFTGHVKSEPWSNDRVKRDYVIEYAAKLRLHFLQ
jgi:hypothetical protein